MRDWLAWGMDDPTWRLRVSNYKTKDQAEAERILARQAFWILCCDWQSINQEDEDI